MGKTMLLARIAAELRTKPEFASRFIPLVFAEEQYAVDRLSKFWLNCLDSLADAREAANAAKAVEEIDSTVARLQAAGVRAANSRRMPAANTRGMSADAATGMSTADPRELPGSRRSADGLFLLHTAVG